MRMPSKPIPGYAGVADGDDYIVVRLDKIEAGETDASATEHLNRQLGSALGTAEAAAVMKVLREQYQVQVLPEAAQAIQGEAEPSAG